MSLRARTANRRFNGLIARCRKVRGDKAEAARLIALKEDANDVFVEVDAVGRIAKAVGCDELAGNLIFNGGDEREPATNSVGGDGRHLGGAKALKLHGGKAWATIAHEARFAHMEICMVTSRSASGRVREEMRDA